MEWVSHLKTIFSYFNLRYFHMDEKKAEIEHMDRIQISSRRMLSIEPDSWTWINLWNKMKRHHIHVWVFPSSKLTYLKLSSSKRPSKCGSTKAITYKYFAYLAAVKEISLSHLLCPLLMSIGNTKGLHSSPSFITRYSLNLSLLSDYRMFQAPTISSSKSQDHWKDKVRSWKLPTLDTCKHCAYIACLLPLILRFTVKAFAPRNLCA